MMAAILPGLGMVSQKFLREIQNWNNVQVGEAYGMLVNALNMLLPQFRPGGVLSGETSEILSDLATTLLWQVVELDRKLGVLAWEYDRTHGVVEPGELTVSFGPDPEQLPTVISSGGDFIFPDHLVLMLKNAHHQAGWVSHTYKGVFLKSSSLIINRTAGEVFPGTMGAEILRAEREVLKNDLAELNPERFALPDGTVLHRVALRFKFPMDGQIGVLCWDVKKGLPPLRELISETVQNPDLSFSISGREPSSEVSLACFA